MVEQDTVRFKQRKRVGVLFAQSFQKTECLAGIGQVREQSRQSRVALRMKARLQDLEIVARARLIAKPAHIQRMLRIGTQAIAHAVSIAKCVLPNKQLLSCSLRRAASRCFSIVNSTGLRSPCSWSSRA